MPIKHTDPLEERLQSWELRANSDPDLATDVFNRIAADNGRRRLWWNPALLRWGSGLVAAILMMAGIFVISQQLERKRMLREGSYLMLIDPVSRIEREGGRDAPSARDSLVERLAWMQDRLDLTQDQFLGLVDLHRTYSERFDQLYSELVRLDGRVAEFEGLRKQDALIDFIDLYEVLKERRAAEDSSLALSREFISRVASLLGPDQRARYLSLVQHSPDSPDA